MKYILFAILFFLSTIFFGQGQKIIVDVGQGPPGSKWYSGTVIPTTQYVVGDWFLHTTTWDVYEKTASPSTWTFKINIRGAQGIQGIQGVQGNPGTNGIDGKTVLNGTINPTGGIGSNGDFYINTNTWNIFGPKTAGAWGSGTPLQTNGSTDLGVTGTSSPLTLTSSTGNDVTLTGGSNISLSGSTNNITINGATQTGTTNLSLSGSSSPYTLISDTGGDVTFSAGSNITLTRTANDLQISSTGGGGITGSGTTNQVTYWNSNSSITSGANLIFNGTQFGVGGGTLEATTTLDGNVDWDPAGTTETPTKFVMNNSNGKLNVANIGKGLRYTGAANSYNGNIEVKTFKIDTFFQGQTGPWFKNDTSKLIQVIVIAGGGGGGSGAGRGHQTGGSVAYATGGNGGNSGGQSREWYLPKDLPGSVPITVGNGGSAGAQASFTTTTGANGGNGATGQDSGFGTLLIAKGGLGGNGGTQGNTLQTPLSQTIQKLIGTYFNGSQGGLGGYGTTIAGSPPLVQQNENIFGSFGGGGGGGMYWDGTNYFTFTGGNGRNLTNGLHMPVFNTTEGLAATSSQSAFRPTTRYNYISCGGGGGHPNQAGGTNGANRNGAVGSFGNLTGYGAGGGGGAGVITSTTTGTWFAGSGGAGAPGMVIVIQYF